MMSLTLQAIQDKQERFFWEKNSLFLEYSPRNNENILYCET